MANFDEAFAPRKSLAEKFSPGLDTKARYRYLYQVVNDCGMDPGHKGIN
jgi:hypothetical protein